MLHRRRLFAEGRGRQFVEGGVRLFVKRGVRPFVKREGKPFAKGRDHLSREWGGHSSKEGRSCLSRQRSPSAKGTTRLLSKVEGQPFVKRKDASCSLREGGCQPFIKRGRIRPFVKSRRTRPFIERGKMPVRKGGCQHGRGRMPAQEREDAGHLLREEGCQPFIEKGR